MSCATENKDNAINVLNLRKKLSQQPKRAIFYGTSDVKYIDEKAWRL